jgi:homogentisate phytyltransferase/homogentisate geranylgeranyltransferase
VDVDSFDEDAGNLVQAGVSWFDAFYRFSRPHTIIGSTLSVISVSLLAIQSPADVTGTFFVGLLQAVIPALLMNVYIVGLNQIYDIEIDKVNKPYLPLASGEFSLNHGITLVTVSALLSLGLGLIVGSTPLLWALSVSFILGTAYSADVPLLRWKKSAVAAASCILAVRAVVVQLGFYQHMQAFVMGRAAPLSRPLWFTMGFMSFFSIVIALAKDIPDIEGDKIFGIKTFSVRVGQNKVFWMCVGLLQAAYASACVVGITSTVLWSRVAMVLGHVALATILWLKSQSVDLKSRESITSWYMFIWKLFYAEYFLIPLMR